MTQFKQALAMLCSAILIATAVPLPSHAQAGSGSYAAGRRWANWYAFGYERVPGGHITSGNSSTGSQTITVCFAQVALPDGRTVNVLGGRAGVAAVPITIDPQNSAVTETVTPTAVSLIAPPNGENANQAFQCANITASFTFTHGPSLNSKQVISGDAGLQEALNDAETNGGGLVVIDGSWQGTQALLTAATPYANVSIEDLRSGVPQFWNPQGGATTLAAPTTLTATTVGFGLNGANTTGGTYVGANTYFACVAYVDIFGQEGPCSATFSALTAGTGSTNQIGFAAPAASTGAVGYTIYISLTSGSYNLSYKVPLVTQPTVIGSYPAANAVCTLTTIEKVTPACAVTNATYNQTGVTAQVSALTVNTSPITPQVTVISTTSVYVPNAGGRTTYAYAPGSHIGAMGVTVPSALVFTIGAAAGTTVPDVVGTVDVAPGAMNVVGKTLEICGEATTTASTATIIDIQFQWDSIGQNTAGKGVLIGDVTATPSAAIATTGHAAFCQDFQTTVASASATGGSINHVNSYGAAGGLTLLGTGAFSDALAPGAVGSLNLADDARINVIYLHTTGTDGAGWTLQNLTAKLI